MYLRNFCRKQEGVEVSSGKKVIPKESALKKARFAFGTGLTTVDEMREKRCTWTLKGWKDTDEDGNEIMRATEEGGDSSKKKEDGENGGMEVDDDKENDAGKDNIDDGKSAVSRFFEKCV